MHRTLQSMRQLMQPSMLPVGGGGNPTRHLIDNSIVLNAADSAYMHFTPGATGDRKKWTWAGYIKPNTLFTDQMIFSCSPSSSNRTSLYFSASGAFAFSSVISTVNSGFVYTDRIFDDLSAWYFILAALDAVNNQLTIEVNGQTASTTISTAIANTDHMIGSTNAHNIGRRGYSSYLYLDACLSRIYFIDGQELTSSDFGETDHNEVWVPKQYLGTYGTYGFHLNFSDSGDLGNDVSGNNNDFTTSGITSDDQVVDTPTNNHAVLCDLDPPDDRTSTGTGSNAADINDGNVTQTGVVTAGNHSCARSTMAIPQNSTKKYYLEVDPVTFSVANNLSIFGIGLAKESNLILNSSPEGTGAYTWAYRPTSYQRIQDEGVNVRTDSALQFTTSDMLQIAYDASTGKLWFGKNNSWFDSSGGTTGDPATGANPTITVSTDEPLFAVFYIYQTTSSTVITQTVNFGAKAFQYTPPTGFAGWCTDNLGAVAIDNPADYFNAIPYTGIGSTQSATGAGHQPDLVWLKNRDTTDNHKLIDSVRGAGEELESNTTDAETTNADGLTSFDSDGFSLGADAEYNTNTEAYIAWCWKKGVIPGMDVVTFNGTGVAHAENHDLGKTPGLMVLKELDNINNWPTYHHKNTGAPETDYLDLSATDATADLDTIWNDTAPTSTQFTVGTANAVNRSGGNIVALLFAEITGFSKFGSYIGNGAVDGPFVYCGFRTRFILYKRTDVANLWGIHDTTMNPYNLSYNRLRANSNVAEETSYQLDIISNGFKIWNNDASMNANGGIYIFGAFAEHPFGGSNVSPAPAR